MAALKIPAVYMRGGTRKAVFFNIRDLPRDPAARDPLLLRVLGSPDPYSSQTDGMGSANRATSNVVLVGASSRSDCDVDCLFGKVAVDRPVIDWSGNGGNLAAAVGPFAVQQGLVRAREGTTPVRIWHMGPERRMVAHVEVRAGEVVEDGAFIEDGIPFPAAEVRLDFMDESVGCILPTGKVQDLLAIEGVGELAATLLDAGLATVFVRAGDLGLTGREKPEPRREAKMLPKLEAIRVEGAVAMGVSRARALKGGVPVAVVWVAPPSPYKTIAGLDIARESIDVLAGIMFDGQFQRAFDTRLAIALASAAALPGSVVSQSTRTLPGVATRIGYSSGVQTASAAVAQHPQGWVMERATVSRSARCLMSGWVHVPAFSGGLC